MFKITNSTKFIPSNIFNSWIFQKQLFQVNKSFKCKDKSFKCKSLYCFNMVMRHRSALRVLSTSKAFDGTFVKLLPSRYKQSRFPRYWKSASDILKILPFDKSSTWRAIVWTKEPLPRTGRQFLQSFKY